MSPTYRSWLLPLVLLLSACSTTTFFYNRLDFLLPWYLDKYVELNRQQDQYLDQLLKPFLQQHRIEALPRYIEFLEQAQGLLQRPVSARDVADSYERARDELNVLQKETMEWLLQLGAELSDEQVSEFIDKLRKQQAKYIGKYLDRDESEYREDAYDNLLDSAEEYLGRLNREQRDALQVAVARFKRLDQPWLDERRQWIDTLERLLRREPGWQQRIREAEAARYRLSPPEYQAGYEHNLSIICDALAQLLNNRSERQDRYLRRKLQNLREDLQTLVEQGGE